MSEKFNILQAAMASSERIFGLLDEPVSIQSPPSPTHRPAPANGHIVFEHVWFSYLKPERQKTTRTGRSTPGTWRRWTGLCSAGREFRSKPGERVGIVGATGSGKTTLISLLMRFYDVPRGRITIDGVDIRDLPLADVRGCSASCCRMCICFPGRLPTTSTWETQPSTIIGCNVRRVPCMPTPSSNVCPIGYMSPVAERGATLSTGQKQLLSFARALAYDPRVLILDEATSSVDTETELLIRDALRALMSGRTTIAIAHRLSTIQDMDKILVLHKGRLRESGSHQELLAQRRIYFKLFELRCSRPGTHHHPIARPE